MSDKKKEPQKPEIRAEDEIAQTITIWLCRVMLWTSLIWFIISFFRWCDVYGEKEFYLAWGSFLFALFWSILMFIVDGTFCGTGQDEDQSKAHTIGFDSTSDGDNSGSPV